MIDIGISSWISGACERFWSWIYIRRLDSNDSEIMKFKSQMPLRMNFPPIGPITFDGWIMVILISNNFRQVSNIRRTLVGNEIVGHSDVVWASPVGAAPTTSSFPT